MKPSLLIHYSFTLFHLSLYTACHVLVTDKRKDEVELRYRTFNDHGRDHDNEPSATENILQSSVSNISTNIEGTSTAQGSSRIAESTSTIFVTSLDVVFISENSSPSQTFPALATLTAPPRANSASRRLRLPFFWTWLRT